jgi:glycosyltransferase involved in cell wall biosynthesis
MLTSSYPRYEGDIAGTFVKSLATHVARLGHEVHVLAPDDGRPDERPADPDGVVEHRFPYAPHPRLRVMGYARTLEGDQRLRRLAYAALLPFAASAFAHLVAVATRAGCDLLHAHWVLPNGPIAAAAAVATARPLVLSLHGSDVYVAERNRAFGLAARLAMRRAAAVTACSADLRERALRLGAAPARARVIPYGVDPARFADREADGADLRRRLGIPAGAPLLLAFGRLVPKKGFEHLVDAMPAVLERHPAARLVLGGGGALEAELRSRAARRGVAAALLMPGRIAWTDVPALLAAADLFVLPSVPDAAGNVDGLPNVLLEAMASGRAVVATRVGGVAQVVEDGCHGRLVPPGSPAALAAAIGDLLGRPDERRRLGAAARRRVETELTWRRIAADFVALYATLTPGRAGPAG